jgi:hypothetical protein
MRFGPKPPSLVNHPRRQRRRRFASVDGDEVIRHAEERINHAVILFGLTGAR